MFMGSYYYTEAEQLDISSDNTSVSHIVRREIENKERLKINMKQTIVIDIGGTAIKYGVIDESLTLLSQGTCHTEAYLGGPHIVEKIKKIVSNYQKKYHVEGIAISTAGIVDEERGEITYASKLIPNYTGTKLKEIMERTFGLPCEVENDVNCAGLSEARVGAGKGAKISICLTIGTGIGGCLILNDKIYHGFSGSAMEVGYLHIPGGDFQNLSATRILVERVAEKKGCSKEQINGKIIFDDAKKGDKICIKAIDDMLEHLCIGIANLCYVLNPEVVILGGGIMAQREYIENRIKEKLQNYLLPSIYKNTRITTAKNGNLAGMLGAYLNFVDCHKQQKEDK